MHISDVNIFLLLTLNVINFGFKKKTILTQYIKYHLQQLQHIFVLFFKHCIIPLLLYNKTASKKDLQLRLLFHLLYTSGYIN